MLNLTAELWLQPAKEWSFNSLFEMLEVLRRYYAEDPSKLDDFQFSI